MQPKIYRRIEIFINNKIEFKIIKWFLTRKAMYFLRFFKFLKADGTLKLINSTSKQICSLISKLLLKFYPNITNVPAHFT